MAEITWEKTLESAQTAQRGLLWNRRYAYLIVGMILIGAVLALAYLGLAKGRYYITVEELLTSPDKVGKNVRVAGAVDGETIRFDPQTQTLTFTIVNIPNDNSAIRQQGGLGAVLHKALLDPNAARVQISWKNAEMPDLLQHEAQAIVTGKLGEDGIFYAEEVLLKCPTKYSDEVPQQTAGS
jgi:cytochrome c-type biogenesis protein CcmE